MPAHDRDRKLREEAQVFCQSRSSFPQPCLSHKPTLEELQKTTFSDYVRDVVLRKAERGYEDADENAPPVKTVRHAKELVNKSPTPYKYGMAKISLPDGFCSENGIANDRSGRGADWKEGTPLGDMVLPSPIKQCVRGIGGIYEFTFLDLPPTTAAEFRSKADKYLKEQLGNTKDMSIELIERKFWKRLGPTMHPSMYGADMEGTLFGDEDCSGWNVSKLQSCLQLLHSDQPDNHEGGIPGVTTPYLYFGMWASVFCAHTEDMNLLSINYLHAGAPKIWYAVAAGEDAQRLEQFCEGHYHQSKTLCPEYLRHKRCLVSPTMLKKSGIPFTTTVQYPGDAMITFPGSYHFGFNTGFNIAEATNFAVPEWVPYGKLANVCLCRPDSVRVDMQKFERLLLQYEKEVKQSKRLTWKDWALRIMKKRKAQSESPQRKSRRVEERGTSQKRKAFWVEVMQPISGKGKTTKSRRRTKSKKSKKAMEVWHLAKPSARKALRTSVKVLCIVSAEVEGGQKSDDSENDEDEQCFSGVISEIRDDHVRIHFDGLGKKDDSWMPVDSPKLFLDGGKWGETVGEEELPPLHYWCEQDSRRRCT